MFPILFTLVSTFLKKPPSKISECKSASVNKKIDVHILLPIYALPDVVPHPTPPDVVRLRLGLRVEHWPHAARVQRLWLAQVDDAEPVRHVGTHVGHLFGAKNIYSTKQTGLQDFCESNLTWS